MILGLDISTSIIGVSLINDKTGDLELVECVNLKKEKNLFTKALMFRDYIVNLKHFGITAIAIEEPLVMYQPGFSRAQILSKLSMFNGMIATMCLMVFELEPTYYNVNHARKVAIPTLYFQKGEDRKHKVWKAVSEIFSDIEWIYGPRSGNLLKENYDMADSIIISLAHYNNECKVYDRTVVKKNP